MTALRYVRTRDGHLAVRVGHLIMALVQMQDGSLQTMDRLSGPDPEKTCSGDYARGGFRSTSEYEFRREAEEFKEHCEHVSRLARRPGTHAEARRLANQWDVPDSVETYAEGVLRIRTPGHGGFLLDERRNERVAAAWRNPLNVDGHAEYEEDCEAGIVMYSMPELFTDWEMRNLERNLRAFLPDQWEMVTGVRLFPGQSLKRDRREFLSRNAEEWIMVSTSPTRKDPSISLVVSYKGGRDERGGTKGPCRYHLVPTAECERRRTSSISREWIIRSEDVETNRHGEPISIAG